MRSARSLATGDVARHGSLIFIALLAVNAANYIFYALASRTLGVVEYGTLTAVIAVNLILTAPATVAQNTVGKVIADVRAAGDEGAVGGLVHALERFALVIAALLIVLGLVFAPVLMQVLHLTDPWIVPIAALAAAVAFVVPFQRGVFQGVERFGDLSLSLLLEAAMRIACVIPLARIAGVRGVLAALVLSLTLPLGVAAWRTRAIWPRARAVFADLRRFAAAGLKTGAGFLAITTMLYFDVVLVRHFLPGIDAGLYSATSLVGRALYSGVAFVPIVLIPKIVARHAAGKSTHGIALLGIALTVGAALAAIAIVALVPGTVIRIIGGAQYAAAAPLLVPYVCAVAALAATNVVAAVRVGLHRFSHVVPVCAVMCAEIVAVGLRHATVYEVLQVIVVGHAIALVLALGATVIEDRVKRRPGIRDALA